MKILTVIVICISMKPVISDIEIECTEFNKTRYLPENDIQNIINEIKSFNKPKMGFTIDKLDLVNRNENDSLVMTELVEKHNYTIENHVVTTADGYMLTMFRLPRQGPAVFLMHGLLGSSVDWVLAGPKRALAYLLADEGFDVWMGNARGNEYSRKHMKLSPNCEEFWEFSWDEIGRLDLPAMIEYVLDLRQLGNLSFVGYNQGCTACLVMCSEHPEFNSKVSVMVALSPVAFASHVQSPIFRILSYNANIKYVILKAVGSHEIAPNEDFLNQTGLAMCENNEVSQILCSNFNFLLFGFNQFQLDIDDVPTMVGHSPSHGSVKQLLHYAQLIESGSFRKYDHDESTNMNLYGLSSPPEYHLENITAPIALLYSDEDWMANAADIELLKNRLPNVIDYDLVKNYNYIDWFMGKNVKERVYNTVLQLVQNYSREEKTVNGTEPPYYGTERTELNKT